MAAFIDFCEFFMNLTIYIQNTICCIFDFEKLNFILPTGNYQFKVNNRNIVTRCTMHSILTVKTTGYIIFELKNQLKSWQYPKNAINSIFHNARLQGPAPLQANSNNIPFVIMHYNNANYNEKVSKICKKLNCLQSGHLKNLF